MKPFKAEEISSTTEALFFITARADKLQSLLRAMEDTAQNTGEKETDRDTLNRVQELAYIMEDELEYLQEELTIASEVELRERKREPQTA